MYTEIVVPLDGSDTAARALGPAATLAEAIGVDVTVISAVAPSFASATADRIKGQAATAGIREPSISLIVSSHPPADQLLRSLDTSPEVLLCMATTGRSHLGQIVGSVAEALIRACTGPFLLIGPDCDASRFTALGPMLVAVDGSETSEEILPLAADWAATFGFEPTVTAVAVGDSVERHAKTGPAAWARDGAEYLTRLGTDPVHWDTVAGSDAAAALAHHADEADASLLAMTTHGRTGLPRLLFGSVTMEVVHRAPCPVLVHRPLRLRT